MLYRLRYLLLILFFGCLALPAQAQELSFRDSIAHYHRIRLKTNHTGALILTGWGLTNVAAGGTGYFAAQKDEWKYFHEMNAGFGVVNTIVGAANVWAAQRAAAQKPDYSIACDQYKANRRRYLYGSALDAAFIVAGIALTQNADKSPENKDVYNGFGKALVTQGAALLIFNNAMYALHGRMNARWFQLMTELRFTGASIGYVHTFR